MNLIYPEYNEERLLRMWHWSSVGMAIVSPTGILLESNSAFARNLEYTTAQLKDKHVDEVTFEEDRGTGMEELKRVVNGEIPVFRQAKRYITRSGDPVEASTESVPIRDDVGEVDHFVSIIIFKISGSADHVALALMQAKYEVQETQIMSLQNIIGQITGQAPGQIVVTKHNSRIDGDNNIQAGNNVNQGGGNKAVWMMASVAIVALIAAIYFAYYATGNPNLKPPPEIPQVESIE